MREHDARVTEALARLLGDRAALAPQPTPDTPASFQESSVVIARLAMGLAYDRDRATLRKRVLGSLDPCTPLSGLVERLASFLAIGSNAAQQLLSTLHDRDAQPWTAGFDHGHRLLRIANKTRRPEFEGWLVHLEPGARFPRHRHHGEEWCFNLAGRAEEDNGRLWEPGDLLHWNIGSCHAYRALEGRPHTCAVVLRDGVTLVGDDSPGVTRG